MALAPRDKRHLPLVRPVGIHDEDLQHVGQPVADEGDASAASQQDLLGRGGGGEGGGGLGGAGLGGGRGKRGGAGLRQRRDLGSRVGRGGRGGGVRPRTLGAGFP